MSLDYSSAGIEVREDLRAAHRFLWDHLSGPGSWWSGRQRLAIAREARNAPACELCDRRKRALSPEHESGAHDTISDLPDNVVEIVHRVRNDPARLSRDWFDRRIAAGITSEEYVELVGVVTLATGVDLFCRALGTEPFSFPVAREGEPSHRRPVGAKESAAWVPMVAPEDASGPEADLYAGIADAPNIMRALSLVPDEARALQKSSDAHYVPVAQIGDPTVRRALDRMQMELVASRVSALNECFY